MAQRPQGILYSDQLKEAIHSVFPPQWFSRFKSHGNTKWKPQVVFWVSQVMNWQGNSRPKDGFEAACDLVKKLFPRWKLGKSIQGFLEARQRVSGELGTAVHERLQKAGMGYFDAWKVRGWMLFSVDGSRFNACRTTANEKGLGCAGKDGTTPQVFQTTLLHVGTGLPWNFRIGPGTDSERRHLDDMLDSLPPCAMLTADAGFISFDLCRRLVEQGRSFLLRVGSNVHLLVDMGWKVESQGKIVYLWPHKHRKQPPMVLRLIVVWEEGRQPMYLATNVLDESTLSDADAVEIYRRRWGIELYYRTVKQTMDYSRLRSRRPDTSLVEQSWNIHTTWLLQLLTARRLMAVDKPPTSWSAARARDQTRRMLRRALAGDSCSSSETFFNKLQTATIDGYRRRGPKTTRVWPRQNPTKPPGPPHIQSASPKERQQAQRLRQAPSPKF